MMLALLNGLALAAPLLQIRPESRYWFALVNTSDIGLDVTISGEPTVQLQPGELVHRERPILGEGRTLTARYAPASHAAKQATFDAWAARLDQLEAEVRAARSAWDAEPYPARVERVKAKLQATGIASDTIAELLSKANQANHDLVYTRDPDTQEITNVTDHGFDLPAEIAIRVAQGAARVIALKEAWRELVRPAFEQQLEQFAAERERQRTMREEDRLRFRASSGEQNAYSAEFATGPLTDPGGNDTLMLEKRSFRAWFGVVEPAPGGDWNPGWRGLQTGADWGMALMLALPPEWHRGGERHRYLRPYAVVGLDTRFYGLDQDQTYTIDGLSVLVPERITLQTMSGTAGLALRALVRFDLHVDLEGGVGVTPLGVYRSRYAFLSASEQESDAYEGEDTHGSFPLLALGDLASPVQPYGELRLGAAEDASPYHATGGLAYGLGLRVERLPEAEGLLLARDEAPLALPGGWVPSLALQVMTSW